MGGGEYRTMDGSENEGSLAWNWWNRTAAAGAPAQDSSSSQQATSTSSSSAIAGTSSSHQETEDLSRLNSVVPRPPAKSKPIDIPKKKATPPPVFEVAQDKRYWYQ